MDPHQIRTQPDDVITVAFTTCDFGTEMCSLQMYAALVRVSENFQRLNRV